jgi:secreted Zn-dependent insulinase-like peptidase
MQIYITWELPAAAMGNYQAKPLEYMASYFGNHCKNGLSYYLRKK